MVNVGKYTSSMDAPLSHSPLGEGFAMPTIEAFAKYSSVALFGVVQRSNSFPNEVGENTRSSREVGSENFTCFLFSEIRVSDH